MGRILKKVLIGSGLAVAIFLVTIFLFGDKRTVSVTWPSNTNTTVADSVTPKTPTLNLTDALSNNLADTLLRDNPEGPISKNGKTLLNLNDPKTLIQETINQTPDQFSPDTLIPDIKTTDIKVIDPVDSNTVRNYLAGFQAAILDHLKTPIPADTLSDPLLERLIAERGAAISALYTLNVPRDLVGIHEDMITALGTQQNIFAAIKNDDVDPLRALIAIKFEPEVIHNIQAIGDQLTAYLATHNLNG